MTERPDKRMVEPIRYMHREDIVRCVSDIDPEAWYAKGRVANIVFHRGRKLGEALSADPLAPVGKRNPMFWNSIVYLGQDLLDYMSGYSDEMLPYLTELSMHRSKIEQKLAKDHQKLREEREAFRRDVDFARAELVELVKRHLEASVIDITKDSMLSCGVYFLRRGQEIVYVGQSVAVHSRVSQHRKDKHFDNVLFLPCEREELNNLEGFFIRLLRPQLNGHSKDGVYGAPTSALWDKTVQVRVVRGGRD
jgi:hypothetical protein